MTRLALGFCTGGCSLHCPVPDDCADCRAVRLLPRKTGRPRKWCAPHAVMAKAASERARRRKAATLEADHSTSGDSPDA